MLKVHTSDGLTAEVDLNDEGQFKKWLRRFQDPAFQASITGLTIIQKGVQYSLPRPQGFQDITFFAEPVQEGKGGERVVCISDDVKTNLVIHNGQRASRVTVVKRSWRQVYNPNE